MKCKICKHPKVARHPEGFCNNCGKEIKEMGVLSPTLDKKKQQLCMECANYEMGYEKGWEDAVKSKNLTITVLMKELEKYSCSCVCHKGYLTEYCEVCKKNHKL